MTRSRASHGSLATNEWPATVPYVTAVPKPPPSLTCEGSGAHLSVQVWSAKQFVKKAAIKAAIAARPKLTRLYLDGSTEVVSAEASATGETLPPEKVMMRVQHDLEKANFNSNGDRAAVLHSAGDVQQIDAYLHDLGH